MSNRIKAYLLTHVRGGDSIMADLLEFVRYFQVFFDHLAQGESSQANSLQTFSLWSRSSWQSVDGTR